MRQWAAIVVLAILASGVSEASQAGKLPIPSEADQKKAEADVKGLLKEDFAAAQKEREAKRTLAQRLLAQAADEKNSAAARYVCLRLARDFATESLDIPAIFDSVDRLSQYFDLGTPVLTGAVFTLERNSWKAVALNTARKFASDGDDMLALTDAYLKLASEALGEKNFADAQQAATLAEQYAKAAKLPPAVEKASSMAKEIPELRKEDEAFGDVITAKRDDPQAKLVKGRVSLFVVADAASAMDMFLGCSDSGLVAIAKLEKARPSSSDDMVKVAEGWVALSKKESSALHKRRYYERGIWWFGEAMKVAGGLEKIRIEQRLSEIEAKSGKSVHVNLLKLLRPADAVQGKPWEANGQKVVTPTGDYDRIQVPYEPGEEYVLTVVAQRKKGANALYLGLVAEGKHFVVVVDGGPSGTESMVDGVDGKNSVSNETSYKGKVFGDEQPKTIVCTVRKSSFSLVAEGKKIIEWKSPDYKKVTVHPVVVVPNPKALAVGTYRTEFEITQVNLLPILGKGRALR